MYGIKVTTGCLAAALALSSFSTENSFAEGRSKRSRKTRVAALSEDSSAGSSGSRAKDRDKEKEKESSSADSGSSSSSTSSSDGAAPASDKVGRFMANFKIGPAFGAYNAGHQGAIVLEFGGSVLPNKNAYLLFPLQFEFAEGGGAVILPVGFQYDIAIPKVPGLYLYPRMSLGYAAFIASGGGQTVTTHFGTLIPEFGAKYVYKGRWNFGGEIFSLPIFFNGGGAAVQYRIMLSAGMNF